MNISNDYTFPDVEFVETDTQEIADELTESYETQMGVTLYPADPIRQLLLWFASCISLEHSYLNVAAKRNLPRYAEGAYLDSLAEIFYGVARQEAEAAETVLQFVLAEELDEELRIPAGTEATAGDGITFATTEDLIIPAGETTGTVGAECTESGTAGNGLAVGKIAVMVDQIAYVDSVTNTTQSAGGMDEETDEELYSRLRSSLEGYSTAGTAGSYEYQAMQYNSRITSVKAVQTGDGEVGVTFLTDSGLPTADEITEMQDWLSGDEIRALTDQVTVTAPDQVPFEIQLTYYGAKNPEPGGKTLEELVANAVSEYVTWQTQALGRRINPGKLLNMLYQAGAGYAVITKPTAQELDETECAVLSGTPSLVYGDGDEE